MGQGASHSPGRGGPKRQRANCTRLQDVASGLYSGMSDQAERPGSKPNCRQRQQRRRERQRSKRRGRLHHAAGSQYVEIKNREQQPEERRRGHLAILQDSASQRPSEDENRSSGYGDSNRPDVYADRSAVKPAASNGNCHADCVEGKTQSSKPEAPPIRARERPDCRQERKNRGKQNEANRDRGHESHPRFLDDCHRQRGRRFVGVHISEQRE